MTYYVLLVLVMQTKMLGGDASYVLMEDSFSILEECNRQLEWLNSNPDKPKEEIYKCIKVTFEK